MIASKRLSGATKNLCLCQKSSANRLIMPVPLKVKPVQLLEYTRACMGGIEVGRGTLITYEVTGV